MSKGRRLPVDDQLVYKERTRPVTRTLYDKGNGLYGRRSEVGKVGIQSPIPNGGYTSEDWGPVSVDEGCIKQSRGSYTVSMDTRSVDGGDLNLGSLRHRVIPTEGVANRSQM